MVAKVAESEMELYLVKAFLKRKKVWLQFQDEAKLQDKSWF